MRTMAFQLDGVLRDAVLFGLLERRSRNGEDEVDRPSQAWLAQEKRMRKAGSKCNHHLGSHQ